MSVSAGAAVTVTIRGITDKIFVSVGATYAVPAAAAVIAAVGFVFLRGDTASVSADGRGRGSRFPDGFFHGIIHRVIPPFHLGVDGTDNVGPHENEAGHDKDNDKGIFENRLGLFREAHVYFKFIIKYEKPKKFFYFWELLKKSIVTENY